MTSSVAIEIRNRLLEFCSIVCFSYQGIDCDIDPFNLNDFHLRCGNQECDVDSIEKVMTIPFFLGKSLAEIAEDINDLEL